MDWESLKISVETAAIRGRGWFRLGIRAAALVVVATAGINLLLAGPGDILPVEIYRWVWTDVIGVAAWPLGDFVTIGVGAIVANWI